MIPNSKRVFLAQTLYYYTKHIYHKCKKAKSTASGANTHSQQGNLLIYEFTHSLISHKIQITMLFRALSIHDSLLFLHLK